MLSIRTGARVASSVDARASVTVNSGARSVTDATSSAGRVRRHGEGDLEAAAPVERRCPEIGAARRVAERGRDRLPRMNVCVSAEVADVVEAGDAGQRRLERAGDEGDVDRRRRGSRR